MTSETTEITDSLEALTTLYDTLHAEQDEGLYEDE